MANNAMICTRCGYQGKPKKITPGSGVIELILWLAFLVPGIIYSVWRLTNKRNVCRTCKGETMIPADSPVGLQLMNQQAQKKPDPYQEWEKSQV